MSAYEPRPAANTPRVLFFNNLLLPKSEAFVLAQAMALERYAPVLAGSRVIEGLTVRGIPTLTVNDGSAIGRLRELIFKRTGSSPGFFRATQSAEPSLIHAHFGPGGALILPIAQALGVPLVVTFHGSDATTDLATWGQTGRVYRKRREQLIEYASKFIAVSDFIRRTLISDGFPEEKIVRHYIGIDTRFYSNPDPPSAGRTRSVLFVGRIVEQKGLWHLIKAMEVVQMTVPDVELWVVGDGDAREALQAEAKVRVRKVRFFGWKPPEEVRDLMGRASIHCIPSMREGLGMVCLEAQAMETPVVAFSSGGIPEAVVDGETGILVPERDWRQLAGALVSLLVDGPRRQAIARAGRRHVVTNFSLQAQSRQLEALYDEVVCKWSYPTP
jgi:colanic acid/amylovoran biosynthesis glycosyltransferase